MAVTRSTAADRRQQETSALRGPAFAVQGIPGAPTPGARNTEALLLAAAALVVLLGLALAYLAMAKPLEEVTPKLASGEVVNLNDLRSADQLLSALDAVEGSAERSFAAEAIWKRAHQGELANVGDVERIRIPSSTIEGDRRLTSLRERLDARRQAGVQGEITIPLFSLQQLRTIKPRLVVRTPAEFRSSFWLWTALFVLAFAAVHAAFRLRRFTGDELILPALLLLTGLGLAMMVTVRDPLRDLPLYRGFAEGVLAGAALLLAATQIDYERSALKRMSYVPLLAAFLLSIVLILFGSGPGGSDAKVNLFGWQPVEAIKILVILFLAGYFCDRWEFLREIAETRAGLPAALRIPKLEYLLPPLVAIGLVLVFFFLQKDLGPALILGFLFLTLYCVARGKPWMALLGTALLAAAFAGAYRFGYPVTVSGRLNMWLSPWDNALRGGDHLAQGLWSLAGGAVTGTGLGLGQPQRVPEVHTDLVLAAVGEQLGFLGLLAVVALYALLVWRGFRAAFRAGAAYSFFLALGLAVLIALQILLIGGGILGVLPLSGVVSPFLSSGRTAMLANFLIFGMILAISARAAPGETATAPATRRFEGAARWAGVALAAVLAAIVIKAAQVQVFQADRFLTRGALTLQGDGYRRFEYNPRLVDIAQGIPRGDIVDRIGVLLATSDPAQIDLKNADAVLERLQALKTMGLLPSVHRGAEDRAWRALLPLRRPHLPSAGGPQLAHQLGGQEHLLRRARFQRPPPGVRRLRRRRRGPAARRPDHPRAPARLHRAGPAAPPPLAAGPPGGAPHPRRGPHAAVDHRRAVATEGRRDPGPVRRPGGLRRRRRGARPGDRRPPRLGELPLAGAAPHPGLRRGHRPKPGAADADRPRPLRHLPAGLDVQDRHRHGRPAQESAAREPDLRLQAPPRRPGRQLCERVEEPDPRRSHRHGAARRRQPGEGDRDLLQRLLRPARRLRRGRRRRCSTPPSRSASRWRGRATPKQLGERPPPKPPMARGRWWRRRSRWRAWRRRSPPAALRSRGALGGDRRRPARPPPAALPRRPRRRGCWSRRWRRPSAMPCGAW